MTTSTAAVECLLDADVRRLLHPHLPASTTDRVIMVEGKGCRLADANGCSYLDATGGLWLAQTGHGREEMAEVAATQMRRLEYVTCFCDFGNDQAIQLAERPIELAAPLAELNIVGEVRCAGMGLAFDLVADDQSRQALPPPNGSITDIIRDETGVIARVSSPTNLVLSPPLVMTEDEAVIAVSAVAGVLRRARPEGSRMRCHMVEQESHPGRASERAGTHQGNP